MVLEVLSFVLYDDDFYNCVTLHNPHCQADRVVLSNVMAVFRAEPERSFSLGDFKASAIENAAAVPNLDNITIYSCRGHCFRERWRY